MSNEPRDYPACIRGCVQPCNCDQCAVEDAPSHAPIPREATEGLLCARCAKRIRGWLAEIPDRYAVLDVSEKRPSDDLGIGKGKRSKATGSPALARLDIVTLQDPRTSATERSINPVTGKRDPWDGSIYIPGEMSTWAALLAEEHDIRSRYRTLSESCGLLLRWFEKLVASDWVDECYDALRDIMQLLRAVAGESGRRPLCSCINIYERDGSMVECGAMLYAPKAGGRIRCRSCGRTYEGYGLVALVESAGVAREAGGQASDHVGDGPQRTDNPKPLSRRRIRRKRSGAV